MAALAGKLALLLIALFALPVLLIHAQPYNDRDVETLLAPLEGCLAPCFMGIRPGETTITEVTNTLASHEWVDTVTMQAEQRDGRGRVIYSALSWTWSDSAPGEIDRSQPGRIYFMQPDPLYDLWVVQTIQVETRLRTWLVQQWFGQPASSTYSYHNRRLGYSVTYVTDEQPALVVVSTALRCPATLMHYWDSRARLTLTMPYNMGAFIPFKDAMRYCY